jgi:hypothetical protein
MPVTEELFQTVVDIALDDIYANFICFGKDVSYKYFVTAAVRSIRLLSGAGMRSEKKTG